MKQLKWENDYNVVQTIKKKIFESYFFFKETIKVKKKRVFLLDSYIYINIKKFKKFKKFKVY